MPKETQNKKWKWLIVCLFFAVLAVGFIIFRFFFYVNDALRRADLAALQDQGYQCIMLSFDPEPMTKEPIELFLGETCYKVQHRFRNLFDMGDFLEACGAERADRIYIGLDPVKIAKTYGNHASVCERIYRRELLDLMDRLNDTQFDILLHAPSLEEWSRKDEREFEESVEAYRVFVNLFSGRENVTVYFEGYEEWMIKNPANYQENRPVSDAMKQAVTYCYVNDTFRLYPDQFEDRFRQIRNLKNAFTGYENYRTLRDVDVIFFGDSVIGNADGTTSIPGVVGGLCDLPTYNVALSGTCASMGGFSTLCRNFLGKHYDSYPEDLAIYQGIRSFWEEEKGQEKVFVISFGINDYFKGVTIEEYRDALKEGVALLEEAFPDSAYVFVTPTHIYTPEFGDGSMRMDADGGTLEEYVEAMSAFAEELQAEGSPVAYLDNYHELDIREDNYREYLVDGVHPGIASNFLFGSRIAECIATQLADQNF